MVVEKLGEVNYKVVKTEGNLRLFTLIMSTISGRDNRSLLVV